MIKARLLAMVCIVGALCGTGLACWWTVSKATAAPTAGRQDDGSTGIPAVGEPIEPIPLQVDLDPRKVALGKQLFYDPRLSHDNRIACANCHNLSLGGTDRKARSVGIGGALGDINAPTVFNSGLNFKQFWDGRADTLEDQIDGPVHHPKEMASSWPEVTAKLRQDPDYPAAFAALYSDGIQSHTIKDAIATFERSLTTPNAKFDRFLRGDRAVLTPVEQAGYRLFKDYGCVSCHQGANIGGNMYQVFGVMGDYFADRGRQTSADLGRHNVTGHEFHRHVFKVPSLRNVERTAPYFHDGSVNTLDKAVRIMARYQLGRSLTSAEVERLVAFLKTLTGEYNGKPL